jgi:hypothetical protein
MASAASDSDGAFEFIDDVLHAKIANAIIGINNLDFCFIFL